MLIAIVVSLAPACAAPASIQEDADITSGDAGAAPSYGELFATYFAAGTPGHCATSGCHADPAHNVWLCEDEASCYQGMVAIGLIDTVDPARSPIADSKRSPLTWINPSGGNMPLDAQGDDEAARAAIEAWVGAGATND